MGGQWDVRVADDATPTRIEPLWRELQGRSRHSFFQSWAWIGPWLRTMGGSADLVSLEVRCDGRLVGLSALGRNTITHSRVFAPRALLVSEVGEPCHDALTVEHSGLLMQEGLEVEVVARSLEHLKSLSWHWDELHVSGVDLRQASFYVEAAERVGLAPVVRSEHPYFFVDLRALGAGSDAYLGTLSANTRYQVRRSMRLYEQKYGPLTFELAASIDEAHVFFDRLMEVHQASWTGRGHPGAFANPTVTDFHNALIDTSFAAGEVQLARVRAGDFDLGYLYNFVMDGVVSNYQTGFRYESDGRLKPGLVSHALAVEHNREAGRRIYDFLMGDQRFKRSLARNEERMQWLVLRRGGLQRSLSSGLRGLGRLLTGQGGSS